MGLKEYLFGKSSEDKACKYVMERGYEILDRNFNSKFGEIDIVAKKEEILHFIEVKATQGKYEAAYRLTSTKFDKILKAINFYLLQNGLKYDFQVDLITIDNDNIEWIKNISL